MSCGPTKQHLWSLAVDMSVYQKPYYSNALDPKYTTKTVKHSDAVMVWGSFSYSAVGELASLPENVKVYLELLCDVLPDFFDKSKGKIFMQNGVLCHAALSVTQCLENYHVSCFKA